MKPTKPAISFETDFVIGQTIIALHHSGNEVRHVTIRRISVEFEEGRTSMTITGDNYKYCQDTWYFFSCLDVELAKKRMVEIQFANIKNKG